MSGMRSVTTLVSLAMCSSIEAARGLMRFRIQGMLSSAFAAVATLPGLADCDDVCNVNGFSGADGAADLDRSSPTSRGRHGRCRSRHLLHGCPLSQDTLLLKQASQAFGFRPRRSSGTTASVSFLMQLSMCLRQTSLWGAKSVKNKHGYFER